MLVLLLIIFISKVSLLFVPGFPREVFPIIFQYGLHPYLNIVFSVALGGFFLLKKMWKPLGIQHQERTYRIFIVLLSLYLLFITLMQILFHVGDESIVFQLGAVFLSLFTIYVFGRIVPLQLSPHDFILIIRKITVLLCWISVVVLVLSPATSFKGSRFIGVFKHIPHMVSCATLACCMLFYDFFVLPLSRWRRIVCSVNFFCAFVLLILTGTRSALSAVLVGLIISILIFPSKSQLTKLIKTSLAMSALFIGLFFGESIAEYAFQVIRGEQAVGLRIAQDGVATRLEEFERGYVIFQESPWLGHGLLSKFGTVSESEVGGYNSNKDPHNLFISAAVVGGWGLVALTLFGYVALIIAAVKKLLSTNRPLQILAIYVLTQISILFIYHIHLSIGGIADRIYWIVFGYMAIQISEKSQ